MFAAIALSEGAAGGAGEEQVERFSVELRPLGDDVGDQASVVGEVQVHGTADSRVDVDPVRPDVAREADLEQVVHRLPADRLAERDRWVAHRQGRAEPALDCLRPDGLELRDDLGARQARALPDLQLVQAVDPVVRLNLLVQREPATQLVQEDARGRLGLRGAEDVQDHLADVPADAGGVRRPFVRGQRRGQCSELLELGRGEDTSFRAGDAVVDHQGFLTCASSASRSTIRSRCRSQRSPSGSLLSWASIRPATMAIMQSTSPESMTPASFITATTALRAFTASAYDSGLGSKPGITRRKSSEFRAGSSTANPAKAPRTTLRATRASAGSSSESSRANSSRLPS